MSQPVGLSDEEANQICKTISPQTKGFDLLHISIRVKDIKKSLWFYNNVLGMTLLKKMDFPQGKFSAYFMGYAAQEDVPKDSKEASYYAMSRSRSALELVHNWGTEDDATFSYNVGNAIAHLSFKVPDVYVACKGFEELGVEFKKKPDEGVMKGLAFIRDPDGYPVEIYSDAVIEFFG